MPRLLNSLLLSAMLSIAWTSNATAQSTGWQNREDFRNAIYQMTEQGLIPVDFAVRVENGQAQYLAKWAPYSGDGFHPGFALYPLESREGAESAIETHRDTGGNIEVDELCLVKVAKASDAGVEAWIVYLMPGDAPGVRCIKLPAK